MRRLASHSHGPYNYGSGSMRGPNNGIFNDFMRSVSQRGVATKRNSQGGSNRGQGGGGGRSLKQMYSSLNEYKLNQSENAWKPSKLNRINDSKSKDEKETEELYKKVRGILNKLTPQKFDTLVQQFQNLPITTNARLLGVIKLVFEKAVDEPAFSISYAQLCKMLARLQVMDQQKKQEAKEADAQAADAAQDKTKTPLFFRTLLITRCQQEFETNKKLELDFEKRQKEINENPDKEKRKELQLLFNEEERKIRMKSVGLVTFIGELFKLKMLTANIMNNCIKQLLGKIDEESLECLCKLLTTIGKEFEEQISSNKGSGGLSDFNEYFNEMRKLSKKREQGSKVSSRVRFMLQDVIELRQNNWVPRRDENKPKTMDQIQKDVEREIWNAAFTQAFSVLKPAQQNNQDRGGQRRNNQRSGNVQSDDGWTSVGSSKHSRNTTNYAAEATKIQGLRSTANQELDKGLRGDVMLGPQMGFSSKWGAGAGSSSRTQSTGAVGGSGFTDSNSFSPLLDSADRKMQGGSGGRLLRSQVSDEKSMEKEKALMSTSAFFKNEREISRGERDSRDNSRGRKTQGSPTPSLSGSAATPSPKLTSLTEQPPQRNVDMQRRTQSDTGTRNVSSVETSRESTPALTPTAEEKPSPSPAELSSEDEDKLKTQAILIIEEYISSPMIEESIECYKEKFQSRPNLFVSTCLNFIVEQMKRDKRMKTNQLLGLLMRHKLFSPSVLVSELQLFYEVIYDFEVDIPHIWQYIGQLFGDILLLGVMDFSHLKEASKTIPPMDSLYVNKLDATLREIFKILIVDMVPKKVKELWDSSNVQIQDFISNKSEADKFLQEYPLLEGKEVVAGSNELPYTKVKEKLLTFLRSDQDFDQICSWLTIHVGGRSEDPVFIRHLTEAVIKSSVTNDERNKTYDFDKDILNKYLKLIKRYVDNNEKLELMCLYTVQHVVVSSLLCPSGMLVEVFRELYEGAVISPEGFNKWRQEDTPLSEAWMKEGRGVAVASSKSFFQAIDQAMNEDPDDADEPS